MKSRVHPNYKTKYRVRNWAFYERALIGRGNITIWLSRAAIAAWKPEGTRTRGAPPKYSDLAIETALTLRLLLHLPLRQAEGFLTSLFHLMGLDLRSPDHTTLSRRGQHLNRTLRRVPRRAALHLFIDSTGRSMVGEGEWAAAKHGRRGRRGWKKLHLGVDQAGVIVAQALTDAAGDDASTGIDLIETIASSARTVTADAAYDTLAFYETANTRGTTVVVPPAKTATLSRRNPRSSARDGTIRRISKIGGGLIARQLVGDQAAREGALCFQELAEESDRSSSIPSRLHEDVDHIPILVNRPPQVLRPALHPHEQLIEIPRISLAPPPPPQPSRILQPERQAPLADRLVRDVDAALGEEVLDVPKTEAEPMVQPHRVTDDFRRESVSSVARHTATVPRRHSS